MAVLTHMAGPLSFNRTAYALEDIAEPLVSVVNVAEDGWSERRSRGGAALRRMESRDQSASVAWSE